jgi:hypothetical protein
MQIITELSKNACGLLLFYRHVSDPESGRIARMPAADDSSHFSLPVAVRGDGLECDIDKPALLLAHRELRSQGLIEVRHQSDSVTSEAAAAMGEVYLVRDTVH